jgi:hypothetical protein
MVFWRSLLSPDTRQNNQKKMDGCMFLKEKGNMGKMSLHPDGGDNTDL